MGIRITLPDTERFDDEDSDVSVSGSRAISCLLYYQRLWNVGVMISVRFCKFNLKKLCTIYAMLQSIDYIT